MSRSSRFDKVVLGELTVNLMGASLEMIGKFKLVEAAGKGLSYGSTTISNWPPAVIDKLKELKTAMEDHVEGLVFDDGRGETRASSGAYSGLGEFLGDEAPPA